MADINLGASSDFLFVMCSVVVTQYTNGSMLPSMFMKPKSLVVDEIVHIQSNPILYYPVVEINISLDKIHTIFVTKT